MIGGQQAQGCLHTLIHRDTINFLLPGIDGVELS